MPELAEVELARRLWDVGHGEGIESLSISPKVRVFRGGDLPAFERALVGATLLSSAARGKQMLFRFGPAPGAPPHAHGGLHLAMQGDLLVAEPGAPEPWERGKHDHLVLHQRGGRKLVFRDTRHFGRVLFHPGAEDPAWWTALPPDILSGGFTAAALGAFLARRKRAPLKAVLLMQERFPGIGNWMADEILWRAGLHPETAAGSLDPAEVADLWRTVRRVTRDAVRVISPDWKYPDSWLFPHRWEDGGRCPRCRAGLVRETAGGRTTCGCPACQPRRIGRR